MSSNSDIVGLLRKSPSIDSALSSYGERSPSPANRQIEDFATEVLQAQEALTCDDVSKLMQLEEKVTPATNEKANKICKLCLKLLLTEKFGTSISTDTDKELNSLLQKITDYDERMKIVSCLACLDPSDRSMAIGLLYFSVEMDSRIQDPFAVIFADKTGEERRARAYRYMQKQLDSKDQAKAHAAADLIVRHHKKFIPGPNDPLFQKAKERFITPETFALLYEKYEKQAGYLGNYRNSVPYKEQKEEDMDRFAYLNKQAGTKDMTEEARMFFALLQRAMTLSDTPLKKNDLSPQTKAFKKILASRLSQIRNEYNALQPEEKQVTTRAKIEW